MSSAGRRRSGRLRWNGAIYHQIWKKFQFSLPRRRTASPRSTTAATRRINGIETDVNYVARRPDAERGGGLHGRQDEGEHLQQSSATPTPDCTAVDSTAGPDFIVAPSGTRLPVTPKFKATGDGALQLAGMGRRQGARPGQRHLPGVGAVVARRSIRLVGRSGNSNPNDFLGRLMLDPGRPVRRLRLAADRASKLFATNVFDKRNELSRGSRLAAAARATS